MLARFMSVRTSGSADFTRKEKMCKEEILYHLRGLREDMLLALVVIGLIFFGRKKK